jgi:hypothetical protein
MMDVKAKPRTHRSLCGNWKPLKDKPQGRYGPCATLELLFSRHSTPVPNVSELFAANNKQELVAMRSTSGNIQRFNGCHLRSP